MLRFRAHPEINSAQYLNNMYYNKSNNDRSEKDSRFNIIVRCFLTSEFQSLVIK